MRLIVLRGLPASGKSTRALELAQRGYVRVCRDDLRMMLTGTYSGLTQAQEGQVTVAEEATVRAALKAGESVVVDAMHLRPRYVRKWAKVALEYGAEFHILDAPHITIEESVGRNAGRRAMGMRHVPTEAILDMRKYLGPNDSLQPVDLSSLEQPTVRKYEPRLDKPSAIIVDIDGTLAHMNGRDPHDLRRVGEDLLDDEVAYVAELFWRDDVKVILLSGREDSAREDTVDWLNNHGVIYDELHMRPAADKRKDSIVKAELFDAHVRDRFNVLFVLDDRDQVVETWRAMGLKCFQVAEGNF